MKIFSSYPHEAKVAELEKRYDESSIHAVAERVFSQLQKGAVDERLLADGAFLAKHLVDTEKWEKGLLRFFVSGDEGLQQKIAKKVQERKLDVGQKRAALARISPEGARRYFEIAPKEGPYWKDDAFVLALTKNTLFQARVKGVVEKFTLSKREPALQRFQVFEKSVRRATDEAAQQFDENTPVPDGAPFLQFLAFFVAAGSSKQVSDRDYQELADFFSKDVTEYDFPGIGETDYQTLFTLVQNGLLALKQLSK